MKKKKISWSVVATVIFTVIGALLTYISNSTDALDNLKASGIIGANVDVARVKDIALLLSIAIEILAISIPSIVSQCHNRTLVAQIDALIANNKRLLIDAIHLPNNSKLDVRIFLPKKKKKRVVFRIKNVEYLCESGTTNDLEFEVFPKTEGLVGKCYSQKKCVWDDNLKNTNDKKYKLTREQKTRTASLAWSLCFPLVDGNDNVIAIIALDGPTPLSFSDCDMNMVMNMVGAFAQTLKDSVPKLFKEG